LRVGVCPTTASLGSFWLGHLDPVLGVPRALDGRRYDRLGRIDARAVFPTAGAG
jgi:hypothetical protein